MLGEKIGEETGKVTAQRVLPGHGARVETSFKTNGTLLGMPTTGLGTYESVMRSDGTLVGEGQGVVVGKDGGTAQWRGQGVGVVRPDGSASYRGSIVYTTEFPKWARLNSYAVVFEHEVDAEGKVQSKIFEWK